MWTTAKGTILTCNILTKRGIMLVDWWSMCRSSSEIILLLHCDIAYALWTIVFCVFGIQQVMPKRVIDLLTKWNNWFHKDFFSLESSLPMSVVDTNQYGIRVSTYRPDSTDPPSTNPDSDLSNKHGSRRRYLNMQIRWSKFKWRVRESNSIDLARPKLLSYSIFLIRMKVPLLSSLIFL